MLILTEGSQRHQGFLNRSRNIFMSVLAGEINSNPTIDIKSAVDTAKKSAEDWYYRKISNNGYDEYPEYYNQEVETLAENHIRGNDGRLDSVKEKWDAKKRSLKAEKAKTLDKYVKLLRKMGHMVTVSDTSVEIQKEDDINQLLSRLNALGYKVLEVERDDETYEVEDK